MKKLAMIMALAFTMGLAASTVNASTVNKEKKTEKKECAKSKECTSKEKKTCCGGGAAKTEAPAKK